MSSPTLTDAGLAGPSASSRSSSSSTTHGADQKAATLIRTKNKSSVRRWLNVVRRVILNDGALKHPDSSRERKSEESLVHVSPPLASSDVVVVPCGPPKEDFTHVERTVKLEPDAFLKHVARNQQASTVPAFASAPAKVDLVAAPEQAAVALTPAVQNVELENGDKTMPPSPAKAKRTRKPRGPTMITPAMMQKIAKDNKKRQGSSALQAEVKKHSTQAVSSAPRANGIRANPLRWSQD